MIPGVISSTLQGKGGLVPAARASGRRQLGALVLLLAVVFSPAADARAFAAQPTGQASGAQPLSQSATNTVPPEFAAWWNRLFTFKDGSLYNGMAITFEVYNLYVPTPQRLEEIRTIVKDKPEHPLRVDLQMYEEEIAKPRSNWWTLTAIVRDGEWRVNRTGTTRGPYYMDYAWSKSAAFELSRSRLLVTKPAPDAPEAQRFAQVSSDFRFGLDALLTSDLGQAGDRARHLRPEFNGTKWAMSGRLKELVPGSSVDISLFGTWDPATKTGRIEKVRSVIRRENGDVRNLGSDASDFRYEPLLDLQIPRVLVRFREDGQPSLEYRFKEIRKVSESEMKDLLQVPSPNGTDPVRGKLEFTKVEDYRGGAEGAALATGMPAPPSASKDTPSLRWLGWAAAGGLIALFVGLKLRKSASP